MRGFNRFIAACVLAAAASGASGGTFFVSKKIKVDDDLHVQYRERRDYSFGSGSARVYLYGGTGSFGLCAVSSYGRSTPLISSIDTFSSSRLLVRLNGREYNLNSSAFSRAVRETADGGQICWTKWRTVKVVADFTVLPSRQGGDEDIIFVTLYATNRRTKPLTVEFKGIFDTVLGESAPYHFTTAGGTVVSSEQSFSMRELVHERSITSSDGETSAEFVLSGAGISTPELVVLANRDRLDRSNWQPAVNEKRNFNAITSYMNSAVAVNWQALSIAPGETQGVAFCIGVGTGGRAPRGGAFVDSGADVAQLRQAVINAPAVHDDGAGLGAAGGAPGGRDAAPVVLVPAQGQGGAPAAGSPRTDVDFTVAPVEEYQLDPAYIQNLIDRINTMESDGSADREEIRLLNAELDAILEKVRQQ